MQKCLKKQKWIKNHAKSCFSVKKLISTCERRAEHPFAGRNTQQAVELFTNIW